MLRRYFHNISACSQRGPQLNTDTEHSNFLRRRIMSNEFPNFNCSEPYFHICFRLLLYLPLSGSFYSAIKKSHESYLLIVVTDCPVTGFIEKRVG